jgi:hypothetical protein
VHGSIIHDTSYLSIIEVKGVQEIIERMLVLCCDPQGEHPAAKRCVVKLRRTQLSDPNWTGILLVLVQ